MSLTTDHNGAGEVFRVVLNTPDTQAEIPAVEIERNIVRNQKRDLPRLHLLPEWGKFKPGPVALVAGGPSLNKTLDELRQIPVIVACGSSHDHLVDLGIYPAWCVICDPNEITAKFLTKPVLGCKYLIATGCPQSVFDALEGYEVILWNNSGTDQALFNGEPMIQGGCTVTLRAWSIFIALGWQDIHFFGLDSSFPTFEENHAYEYGPYEVSPRSKARVAPAGAPPGSMEGREFETTDGWMCQALHFREQVANFANLCRVTVHGDGLIAEIMHQAEILAKQKEN